MTVAFAFAVSAALSLILTPLAGRVSTLCGAVAHPDARRQHRAPTPTWGGLAIYTLAALAFMYAGHAWFMATKRGFADVL